MSRAAMQMALEALEFVHRTGDTQAFDLCLADETIAALRAALAEPQCMCREPWALERVHREKTPCFDYVERKPLTDDEIAQAMFRAHAIVTGPTQFRFAKEIERAHGIGDSK